MQNKNNNQKGTMTKIRMNTELRNKLFNKIKNVFENEDTQERELYLQSRKYGWLKSLAIPISSLGLLE